MLLWVGLSVSTGDHPDQASCSIDLPISEHQSRTDQSPSVEDFNIVGQGEA